MPIPVEQKLIAILFSLCLFLVTLQLIRKHKLREQYALIWFGISLTVLVLSVFDRVVIAMASLFAVTYAPTLILVMGLLFCLVTLLAQTVLLSSQADRIRDLAQTVSFLEHRLCQLETGQMIRTPYTARPTVTGDLPKATINGHKS